MSLVFMVEDSIAFLSKTKELLTQQGVEVFAYWCKEPDEERGKKTSELRIDYVGSSSSIGAGLVRALMRAGDKIANEKNISRIEAHKKAKLSAMIFDRDLGSSSQDGPNALEAITTRAEMFRTLYPMFYQQLKTGRIATVLLSGEDNIPEETKNMFKFTIHKTNPNYIEEITRAVRAY